MFWSGVCGELSNTTPKKEPRNDMARKIHASLNSVNFDTILYDNNFL